MTRKENIGKLSCVVLSPSVSFYVNDSQPGVSDQTLEKARKMIYSNMEMPAFLMSEEATLGMAFGICCAFNIKCSGTIDDTRFSNFN